MNYDQVGILLALIKIVVSSSLAGCSMSERIQTWDLDNHYTEGFVPMLKWIDVGTGAYFSTSGDAEWSCSSEETPAELRNDAHAIKAGFIGACNFSESFMALGPEHAEILQPCACRLQSGRLRFLERVPLSLV